MRKLAAFIEARLSLRVFLPLLALALGTTWYGLFWSVERFSELTGGLRFMDMQPGLDIDALFTQIRTYSDETVSFYLGWSAFDYAWPLITFTTMLFITAWIVRGLPPRWRAWFPWLVAFAYLTVLMDWLENMGFAVLVLGLPAEPLWLARMTLALHALKLVFNMAFNAGFWVLLAMLLVTVARKPGSESKPGEF